MARQGEHRLVVDRFEGDQVVVEVDGGEFRDLPRWIFPKGVKEGDVVVAARSAEGKDAVRIELRIDREATEAGRREAGEILERLKKRDPGGDLEL